MSGAFGYNKDSVLGTKETINTDIKFYNPDELAKILQLKTVNKKTIVDSATKYINKFRKEGNNKMIDFFEKAKNKLLQNLEKPHDTSIVKSRDLYSDQNQGTEQLNEWFSEQNIEQEKEDAIIYPLGTTDRKQKVDIYDDHHNVMTQEKLAVQHQPTIIQGQINPTLKNTFNRLVNIDSKFRLSAVPNVKNKKFKNIINHHTSAWSGTDYTLDFNDPLRKVLSFKLYSLQIPYSWYTVDEAYGTNCFVVTHVTDSQRDLVNGSSGITMINDVISRFTVVDGYNIVKNDNNNNVLNFNDEPISGLLNQTSMPFFYVSDTNDIVDANGIRVKPQTGKRMKVLINSKNHVLTANDDNRILDINGYPTRFKKTDFANVTSTGTIMNNTNSKLLFTIDDYGNTVTHISGNDVVATRKREHSPKIIFNRYKELLNVDVDGNIITMNEKGEVKYTAENTTMDLDGTVIFNSDDNFKFYNILNTVVIENGNYTPADLITEINDKMKEDVPNTKIITTEIDYYDDIVSDAIIQSTDRKIVVGGTYFDGTKKKMSLVRYNTSGKIDTTFGTAGKLSISIDINNSELNAMSYMTEGEYIIVGGVNLNEVSGKYDFTITRVTNAGVVDTNFGRDKTGSIMFSLGSGDSILTCIAIENPLIVDLTTVDTNHKIYAAGYIFNTTSTSNKYEFGIIKTTRTGALDTNFGTSGKILFNFGNDDNILTNITLIGITSLIVSGYTYDSVTASYKCAVAKLSSAGVLDTSFSTDGKTTFSFNTTATDSIVRCATKITIATVDYIIIGGYTYDASSASYKFALAMLKISDGSLNTSFGTSGKKIFTTDSTKHHFLTSVAIDSNNAIITTGYAYNGSYYDFVTARMSETGALDTTGFGTAGYVRTSIDNMDLYASKILANLDGKMTLVGTANKNTNSDFALTRYTVNGNIDSTFVNKVNNKTYATIDYNNKNGKSTITTYSKYYSILFYKQNDPFCNSGCGQGPRANNNLGWIIGFRDQEYTSQNSTNTNSTYIYESESVVDTFGPRYFLLSIDDYNSNQINKAVVSIENMEKKADIPSYYSSDLTPNSSCDTSNPLYVTPQYLQGRPPQITRAQQYTLNEILKNRKTTSNNVLTSPTSGNIFAIIPLKKSGLSIGDSLIEFSGPIQINERNYFGPVDIDKFRIQLLDDKGNVINLNGMDWSFSIITEHLYQY